MKANDKELKRPKTARIDELQAGEIVVLFNTKTEHCEGCEFEKNECVFLVAKSKYDENNKIVCLEKGRILYCYDVTAKIVNVQNFEWEIATCDEADETPVNDRDGI